MFDKKLSHNLNFPSFKVFFPNMFSTKYDNDINNVPNKATPDPPCVLCESYKCYYIFNTRFKGRNWLTWVMQFLTSFFCISSAVKYWEIVICTMYELYFAGPRIIFSDKTVSRISTDHCLCYSRWKDIKRYQIEGFKENKIDSCHRVRLNFVVDCKLELVETSLQFSILSVTLPSWCSSDKANKYPVNSIFYLGW